MSDILQISKSPPITPTMECSMTLEAEVLAAFPAEVRIPAALVADAVAASLSLIHI